MRSTVTERGQTVIPAEIRRRFGLTPAQRLEWIVEPDGIRVVPVAADPIEAGQRRGGCAPGGRPPGGQGARVKRYLLDTSALLKLRDDEPGTDRVADLLAQARRREAVWLGCFIGLMDGLYRVWKDEEEHAGRLPYEQCLALPIEWVHESRDLLEAAGALKATHSLSLADAWIAAAAELSTAILVHKDPEFAGCPPTRRRCRTGDLRARRRRSRAQRGCPAGIWLLTANGGGRTALSKAGRGPQMR